jgi:hypothetical protein
MQENIPEKNIKIKLLSEGIYIPDCLLKYPNLSPRAKMCWGLLLQIGKGSSHCSPSQEYIAYRLGISKKTAYNLLHELEQKKFIWIDEFTGKFKDKRIYKEYQGNREYHLDTFPSHPTLDKSIAVLNRPIKIKNKKRIF